MKLRHPLLLAATLSLGLPFGSQLAADAAGAAGLGGLSALLGDVGVARAGNGLIFSIRKDSATSRIDVLPTGRVQVTTGTPGLSRVSALVTSAAGEEELDLIQVDVALHGAAALGRLPARDAGLSVVAYDGRGGVLQSFSGRLAASGAVSLVADGAGAGVDASGCTSRTGCEEVPAADVELRAATVFGGAEGYTLALDFAGADLYNLAWAEVTVEEPTDGEPLFTFADLVLNELGAVWEGEPALAHGGYLEVKAKGFDAAGEKVLTGKGRLGGTWMDAGEGISALATDEDPLTSIALVREAKYSVKQFHLHTLAMTIVSEGWSAGEILPTHARVELTGGGTVVIPVNSRQRRGNTYMAIDQMLADFQSGARFSNITVTGGNFQFTDNAAFDMSGPACGGGLCVQPMLFGDGSLGLSATYYALDDKAPPAGLGVTMQLEDGLGNKTQGRATDIRFDEEITLVFAQEVSFAVDPVGLDLTGKVSLLGPPDSKGKQAVLAKGKFFGGISRDADGELELAGIDKDDAAPRGDVVLMGKTIGFETTRDVDGDGVVSPPPVLSVFGNGSGTKNPSSQTSIKPQLL